MKMPKNLPCIRHFHPVSKYALRDINAWLDFEKEQTSQGVDDDHDFKESEVRLWLDRKSP